MPQHGPSPSGLEQPGQVERPESKEYQEAARQRRLAALHALAEQALAARPDIPPPGTTTRVRTRTSRNTRFGAARRWAPLAGGVALALIVVVVVISAVPSLRARALNGFGGTPVVVKPAVPDADHLYLDADVPWTAVQIDGRAVQMTLPGAGAPLHLSPGRHVISWQADPFPEQRCILNVPAATSDSCLAAFEGIAHVPGEPPAQILRLEEESYNLLAVQLNPLNEAVQNALNSYNQTTPIQAGEPAYINGASNNGSGGVSDGTYTASMTLQLDSTVYAGACQIDFGTSVPDCTLISHQCAPICSLDYAERQSLGSALPAGEWITLASAYLWRNFVSSAGEQALQQQIAFSGVASFSDRVLLVGVRWQNGSWQAQPFLGGQLLAASIQDTQNRIFVDPACAGADAYFAANLYSDGYTQVRFVSGPNIAVGCLIQATLASSGQQLEYIERLGVLLAVNDAAHQQHHELPLAGSYAQQLAATLAANTTIPMIPVTPSPTSSVSQG